MEILHFNNLEQISTTSWGSVYRAHDPLLERTVALKIIRPQDSSTSLSELLAEARAAAALDHPNICPIHQVYPQDDGTLVMVLSWCPGGSLNHLIQNGPLTGEPALKIAHGIVDGLAAIHKSGLLHRDIKPGNILIDGQGQPKLADFGLATLFGDSSASQMTMSGTLPYMAPELFQGQGSTVSSDIWALGAVLFQLVSGQPPFTDTYEAALRYSIEYSDVPTIKLDNKQAQRIMETALACLNKNPHQRPESANLVLDFLLHNPEQKAQNRPPKHTRRWPLWTAGVASLILLAVIFSGPLSQMFSPTDTQASPSGVTILPFTSVGGDDADAALATGLSHQATDAMLKIEHEINPWWFVPTKRIQLRKIDNLTRANGLTGASYAITGRLEKLGDDLYQLSLRKEKMGAGIQDNDDEFVAELTVGRHDLATWQIEIPRRIVQLLGASWPETAESILREGSTLKPSAFYYYLQGLGHLATINEEPDTTSARLAFVQSIQSDPAFALGWWGLGLTDDERGGPGARGLARQKWQHSLSLAPHLEQPLTSLASSFHYSEDDSTALHYLSLLLRDHPQYFKGQLIQGEVFAALGDSAAAHDALNQAMALHPGDAVGPSCLGAFLFNNHGNTKGAAAAFNQAATEASHDPDTLLFLGACHFANDQLNKSQRAFERSLSLERNALALEYLAIIYFYQGSYSRGAALAEELLLRNDSRFEVWNLLGVCQEQIPEQAHLAKNSYEKAAELCRAEILYGDDRPSLWAMMGLIEAELDHLSEAQLWLDKASARKNLSGDTMISLADGYETLGDRKAALFWLKKLFATGYSSVAVERHPGFADLRSDSRYRELH